MRKFIKGVVLCSLVVATLTGCGKTDNEAVSTVESAIENLQKSEQPYMVYNVESSGNSTSECVEVSTKGYTYTEVAYGSDEATTVDAGENTEVTNDQYILYNWVNKDGSAYMLNSVYDAEDKNSTGLWIKMPEGYGKKAYSKSVLYADLLLDKDTLKKTDSESINTGKDELESCDMYVCDVSSETIKSILEIDTLGLIKNLESSVKESKKDDEKYDKVMKFITDSIKDYESMSAYADGKAYFGVIDGKLVYVRLETGGLGTPYTSERVVLDQEVDAREEIDFESDCVDYYDIVVDYLNYVNSANTTDKSLEEKSSEETGSEEDATETTSGEETTESTDGVESTEAKETEASSEESTESTENTEKTSEESTTEKAE